MAMQVCAGAMLQCSFGTAPSALIVTPENKVLTTTPDANIMDHKPIKNIVSFCMCTTQSNPAVALPRPLQPLGWPPAPCAQATDASYHDKPRRPEYSLSAGQARQKGASALR
ncbi:MAG: DUF4280 domain-containing protein [Methanothrix sp.]|nr:MAG: DUF4280 domain-containing protein [Methanothrix sp.]